MVENELLHDRRTHGEPDDGDGWIADRTDQLRGVIRERLHRPGLRDVAGGLADPPVAAEDVSMGDALLRDGVFQRAGNMLLPDDFIKTLWPVLAR